MWRRLLTYAGIAAALMAVLLGPGCPAPTPPEYTMDEAEGIARAFVEQSPTYQFDGIEGTLELVYEESLPGKPGGPVRSQFIYRFQSAHAGYGDRTGQMLAQVITPHEAKITVQEYDVIQAIIDEGWDMLAQSFISE